MRLAGHDTMAYWTLIGVFASPSSKLLLLLRHEPR